MFSKLKQIESLSLSHNNLIGRIPTQLTELYTLAVFDVSYNNLSGSIPSSKAQFGTFDESSYVENPFRCGPPLHKNCSDLDSPPTAAPNTSNNEDKSGLMDKTAVNGWKPKGFRILEALAAVFCEFRTAVWSPEAGAGPRPDELGERTVLKPTENGTVWKEVGSACRPDLDPGS
ncbi:hypothetical protein Goshw_009832, partial [Gossypium schwendimanii]|nr:hypothetical protein [Gossypium schwendimanii]